MAFQELSLLALFPLVFLAGRAISKNSEEEIKEIKNTTIILNKVVILTACFLTLYFFLSIFTTILISLMIFTYLVLHDQSPKEKILIAITSSLSIVYMLEIIIILGLFALFLKGITLYNEGEKIISKISLLQAALFFFTISFKFFAISVLSLIKFF